MSKPIIAIVGATGGQGGSVVRSMLKQGEYNVRGITRNVNSDKAKALRTLGVELVTADMNEEASLVKAFEGVTAIFTVTDFFEPFVEGGPDHAIEVEYKHGVNMARAALQTPTLKHYIWSTLPDSRKISNGKSIIPHVEAKVRIDNFIKSQPELLSKTTFLWVTYFASNFFSPPMSPFLLKLINTYVWISPVAASALYACAGDIAVNVGIFSRAILSNPARTLGGKYVFGNVETMPADEYLQLWGKVTGKRVHYLQVSHEDFDSLVPQWGKEVRLMAQYWEEFGEKSWSGEELVTAADLGVQGELETPADYFARTDWSALDT